MKSELDFSDGLPALPLPPHLLGNAQSLFQTLGLRWGFCVGCDIIEGAFRVESQLCAEQSLLRWLGTAPCPLPSVEVLGTAARNKVPKCRAKGW